NNDLDDVDLINNTKALALKAQTTESRSLDLPLELLVEIFSHTVSGENAVTPYLLGKICREWRALVFDSCSLWQVLELKLEPNRDTQLSLLEEWVSRAGILPLTVIICYQACAGPSEGSKRPRAGLLKPILSLPSTRVSSLSLANLPWGFFFALSGANPVGSWPTLSHLHLSSSDTDQDADGAAVDIFGELPALRSVSIEDLYVLQIILPWSQLLHLRLEGILPYELSGALERATNLLTLSVFSIYPSAAEPLPCTHRTLQYLTFSNDNNNQSTLFNSLRLPGLTNLALQLGHQKYLMSNGKERPLKFEIYPFLSDSGCQLTDLSIDNAALTEPQIIGCLSILPSLRTLRLSNNKWYDEEEGDFLPMGPDLLRFMTSSSSAQQPILPGLEQLTFVGSRVAFSPDVSMGGRGALLERSTISLQTVVFNFTGLAWAHSSDEQELIVEEWKGRGFSVEIERASLHK
ncbi:hypothetical protein DFP72DRAFT_896305, partial [Ephemerocybe angulata]